MKDKKVIFLEIDVEKNKVGYPYLPKPFPPPRRYDLDEFFEEVEK